MHILNVGNAKNHILVEGKAVQMQWMIIDKAKDLNQKNLFALNVALFL